MLHAKNRAHHHKCHTTWRVRHHMLHIIHSLRYYMFYTVCGVHHPQVYTSQACVICRCTPYWRTPRSCSGVYALATVFTSAKDYLLLIGIVRDLALRRAPFVVALGAAARRLLAVSFRPAVSRSSERWCDPTRRRSPEEQCANHLQALIEDIGMEPASGNRGPGVRSLGGRSRWRCARRDCRYCHLPSPRGQGSQFLHDIPQI